MTRHLQRHWPLWTALALYWATLGALLLISLAQNQQQIAYTLDDPYIHMAMARNLVESGVWGVTSRGFSSSSSSPLWTLLLAGVYAVAGPTLWAPLLLNVLFGSLILVVGAVFLARLGIVRWWALATLLGLTFVTPLPALTFVGMEHLLHVLVTLLFVALAARILAAPDDRPQGYGWLLLLAPLATAVRFESMAMVAMVALLAAALRRRWLQAFLLVALGALPIVVQGVIAQANGWYFLPTSVLLKANLPEMSTGAGILYTLGYRSLETLYANPVLLFLVLGALALWAVHWLRQPTPFSQEIALMAVIFVPMALLHLQAGRLGWFYRYEAYLIALGLLVVAAGLGTLPRMVLRLRGANVRRAWLGFAGVAILLGVLAVPFAVRAARSLAATAPATTNIYQQQVQMGLFLRRYYAHEGIVANDIGAISYFTDGDLLDLWGLGTKETAALILNDEDTPEAIEALARERRAKVAIIYDRGNAPDSWIKVGEWTVPNPVTVDPTVSIFAVDPSEAGPLVQHLREFAGQLPPDVIQSGLYTE